ncbi:RING-H2 finger protein ATL51-like [Papaver somniferum]|uniref:RING-H2 finger protein ATL51-like n=1 Tax=Papaver somniferum TaxID=3469 RepID=UPI000E6F9985|nr:RING-H2 finger protein ATL51-like [Papaver somniferum]
MDDQYWRDGVDARARQWITDELIQSLMTHLPPEEFDATNSFAVRFERDVYNSATSREDYLYKISRKALTARLQIDETIFASSSTLAASASASASVPTANFTPAIATPAHQTLAPRGRIRFQEESVKRKLRVMEFGDFCRKSKKRKVEEEDSICSICMDRLETSDKIRELSRCSHVFHKGCLDKWIDRHRFSCPYCRAGCSV